MENSFYLQQQRRLRFTAEAEIYDDGRPGYPPNLFAILAECCGLGSGSQVLEIGPGTGQATGPMLDAGANVTAVELGAEFADVLVSKFHGLPFEVIVGPFETVDLPTGPFDLVAAGTSFHWVPPEIGLPRAAASLGPGGSLALWWNHFGDPDRADPFRQAVQPILGRHAPQLADNAENGGAGIGANPYALDVTARTAEIDASGLFGSVRHHLVPWTAHHTPIELRQMLASFSHWMALDSKVREALLADIERLATNEFGGVVERPYLTSLFTAKLR